MIIVTDIFREIAVRVSQETKMNINYIFGDSVYMNSILNKMNGSKYEKVKFPLLGLYHPFSEHIGSSADYYADLSLNFIIAVNTKSEYDNKQRQEISFKEVLYPVYQSLLNQISKEKTFAFENEGIIDHFKEDEFRFGSRGAKDSSGEIFELIDAIKIFKLKLKIKNQKCHAARI